MLVKVIWGLDCWFWVGLVLEGNLVVKVLINREFGYVKVCLDCGVVVEELGRSLWMPN